MENYKNTIKTTKTKSNYTKKANQQFDLFGFSILGIASELEKQSLRETIPEFNPRALHEPKSSLNVNAPAFQPVLALNPNAKEYSPSKLNVNAQPYEHQSDSSNHGAMIPAHLFKAIYSGNENYYYDISNDSSTTCDSSSAVSYEPQHYSSSSTAFYQQQEEAETNQIGGTRYRKRRGRKKKRKNYKPRKYPYRNSYSQPPPPARVVFFAYQYHPILTHTSGPVPVYRSDFRNRSALLSN